LGAIVLLAGLAGCGGPPPQSDGTQSTADSAQGDVPELSDDVIRERINNAWIRTVPEESGSGEPISWGFAEDEPKEITIVEKNVDGTRATVVLDIKTGTTPRARTPRQLAGQIRTEWELRTGWVLRKWEIVKTENVSMNYKILPKPLPQESKR
jgi:hypothetical protein